jgi:hypothetical protein
MAREKRAAREREEQQNSGQYRGGMMAEETRTEEGGKDAEEKRRDEIKELREARKKEARKKLCIITANVYGIRGTQRMLDCLGNGLEAEVVVIQESKCNKEEERNLESRLSRQGWYMYHLPGTTTKVVRSKAQGKGEVMDRENGGVMIWVRKGLEQKLIHKESQGEARILTVDVQGWRIHGGYAPPRGRPDMATAISMMRVKIGSPPKGPTLAVGDWNEPPGEGVERAWRHHMGIAVVEMKGEDKVTRKPRQGAKGRQIDYFLADK